MKKIMQIIPAGSWHGVVEDPENEGQPFFIPLMCLALVTDDTITWVDGVDDTGALVSGLDGWIGFVNGGKGASVDAATTGICGHHPITFQPLAR